jgi:outer membrane receptor protein involved in Fe transport
MDKGIFMKPSWTKHLQLCLLGAGMFFAPAEADNTDFSLPDTYGNQDTASAEPDDHDVLEVRPITTQGQRAITASNSQTVRDRDLSLRMIAEPADILKVTPGLFVGQHAGGGKANQYFIRGFDIDHGTDLALWFDGMPINNVSHGHGQGYADFHFIIPELVDQVHVNKGPTDIAYGDLATAGSVSMTTRDRLNENQIYLSGGMFNTQRALAMLTLKVPARPLFAMEVYHSDGPYKNPEDMDRFNLFLKAPLIRSRGTALNLTLMGYGAGWNGSGQIPMRAIDNGSIDRYGSEDPSEGGSSQRHSVSLDYVATPNDKDEIKVTAYVINYRLSLFSNFTFFAADSVNGDQINQRDDRVTTGFQASYAHRHDLLGIPATARLGMSARNDLIHTNLDNSVRRAITNRIVDADVREGSLSAWYMQSVTPFKWLYAEAGVRADHFGFNTVDNLNDTGAASVTGVKDATIYSPKINVVVTPVPRTDVFLNYGEGFHSNDARGVTAKTDPARPLTKARGYEIGARTNLWDRWDVATSLWQLDMDGEFVWVGDGGFTEENGSTRRQGIDFETRLQMLSWLWADFDMTLCTAEFTQNAGNGTAVALAPRRTMAGGLSARHPSGLYGSLRAQSIDTRPADEANTFQAQGFTVVDLAAGYRRKQWEVVVNVGNLLNTEWYTAQFENDSRVRQPDGSLEPAPVTDMHVVPGPPVNIKGGVKLYF